VLEHVDDLQRTLDESARVLKPGGLYMYDTINRTRRSKLVLIKLFQEWRSTAIMEPNLHDWDMFIKPAELVAGLDAAGLDNRDLVGIGLRRNPLSVIRDLRRRARGDMTFGEFGKRNVMREMRDTSLAYAGYAIKR
jgi:2-polyprenyl-6-hydroxyphenyl methylase/3-demethylubiquinone-9 3-methyltransferase